MNNWEDASCNHSLKQEARPREIKHFSEKTQVLKPPCSSWWTKSRTKRLIDYFYVVYTLPSPLARALRSRVRFAPEMFLGGDDCIPASPFRRINQEAECLPVCGLLSRRGCAPRPGQNSFQLWKAFSFTRAVRGGDFVFRLPSFSWNKKPTLPSRGTPDSANCPVFWVWR